MKTFLLYIPPHALVPRNWGKYLITPPKGMLKSTSITWEAVILRHTCILNNMEHQDYF